MKPFSLLLKPAGADCNIRCSHCFYRSRATLYPNTPQPRMAADVLERTIRSYLATDQPVHLFSWQGGEPTLMGRDFFEQVTAVQVEHGGPGTVIANGLQTNGLRIDDSFARHLARYRFLVGVSIDGPPELHDRYRRSRSGEGSAAGARAAVERLRRQGAEVNAVTLVTRANAGRAAEVYDYLKKEGFLFQQYVPCVEFDGEGGLLPFSVGGDEWGEFLCALFDEWIRGDVRKVSIRDFDSIVAAILGRSPSLCRMEKECRHYFVVEHNGDIYPCDFFVRRELRIGNVMDMSWEEALRSPVYERFGSRKSEWCEECARCEYLSLCAGDCPKHRGDPSRADGGKSVLCEGWKRFFRHALPTFRSLAKEVAEEEASRAAGLSSGTAGTASKRQEVRS